MVNLPVCECKCILLPCEVSQMAVGMKLADLCTVLCKSIRFVLRKVVMTIHIYLLIIFIYYDTIQEMHTQYDFAGISSVLGIIVILKNKSIRHFPERMA